MYTANNWVLNLPTQHLSFCTSKFSPTLLSLFIFLLRFSLSLYLSADQPHQRCRQAKLAKQLLGQSLTNCHCPNAKSYYLSESYNFCSLMTIYCWCLPSSSEKPSLVCITKIFLTSLQDQLEQQKLVTSHQVFLRSCCLFEPLSLSLQFSKIGLSNLLYL